MKRWSMVVAVLIVVAVFAVGCGGGGDGDTASNGSEGTSRGGPVGQADAAACAANRRIISSAAQQYYAIEGAYPNSIQALVPKYLQGVPACPSGGRYTLQGSTVTCSVHGS
jgi:hypothetical protein